MASRKKRRAEEPKELTRKQIRQNARVDDRNRKIILFTGITVGIALLFVIAGIVYQFAVIPNSALATVENDKIQTQDFWKRVRFQQNQLQNQLVQYTDLERQFGSQGFFASQISQLEGTLSSPYSLGVQVLDQMINETIIRKEADARGLTVTDAEIDDALRAQVASGEGAITVAQATETAEANAAATTTAASWTPTPTPAVSASAEVTPTEAAPTAEPLPTRPIITDEGYQEGLTKLETNLKDIAGLTLAEYRELVRVQLLSRKLQEVIGEEKAPAVEEQVHARHILLRVITPQPTPTPLAQGEPTPEPTLTPTPLAEGEPTPTPTPAPRDDAATLALAQELRQRLVDGEDFATLAEEYSDDSGSAINGGDLGWFGRGTMVPAFEEAAFALAPNEISEPVATDFGYHIIQVLERDDQRPKEESLLQQERAQAFDDWLRERVAAASITRPDDILSKLPSDLKTGLLPASATQ